MPHPWFTATPTPRVLAHRGLLTVDAAAAGVADNTLATFIAAQAASVAYIESDCHMTADGTVVLFHDSTLQRVADDSRALRDVTHAELTDIMATRGGAITLAQALESFPDTCFNLDVKADDAADAVGTLVAPYADRVLLTSFSDRRRRQALAAASRAGGTPATSAGTSVIVRVLIGLATRSRRLLDTALARVDALQVPERMRGVRIVTPRLLGEAHRRGVEVHVWTVNDTAHMSRLLDLGVDGLVTDRSPECLKLVSGRKTSGGDRNRRGPNEPGRTGEIL